MSQDAKKRQVAEAAFEKVRHLLDSETAIGIGTGSTANCFIDVLAESGIQILGAVASSKATEDRLTQYGIELLDLNATGSLPVYVDGADEADPRLNLIKGGGAALTREKIIAEASAQFICIADDSKRVEVLGEFPLPIEVIPMARSLVGRAVVELGGNPEYRQGVVTDNGNIILDVYDMSITDPKGLELAINQIPGVVTCGLFARLTASNLLAQITYQTGIVTVPKPAASQLRQIEFLPLSGDRVLVILVINEREVQNRIIQMQRPMDEEQLKAAAELVNQRYAGNDLSAVKGHIVREMSEARARIDHYLEAALELANAAIETEQQSENVVVAGEASLLNQASPEDMQKLRELFDAFERKRDLLELMERCSRADGIQIFIGEEAGFDVFGDFSVITAPYAQGSQSLGVLGVIGPTRMAYERVIPIVDVTARMLSAALSR